MKLVTKALAIALSIATIQSAVLQRPAHAVMFITGATSALIKNNTEEKSTRDTASTIEDVAIAVAAGCTLGGIITGSIGFGICFLSGDSTSHPGVSAEYIADNGYSKQEEGDILAEALRFKQASEAQGRMIAIQKSDDRRVLEQAMRQVLPDVSDLFVRFTADANGLR